MTLDGCCVAVPVTLANQRLLTGRRLALCPAASFGKLGRAIEAVSQLAASFGWITLKGDNN